MKTEPETEFALVRGPRTDENNNPISLQTFIIKNNGKFDLSNYTFLRMSDAHVDMEEWVPTKELMFYKNFYGIEE